MGEAGQMEHELLCSWGKAVIHMTKIESRVIVRVASTLGLPWDWGH